MMDFRHSKEEILIGLVEAQFRDNSKFSDDCIIQLELKNKDLDTSLEQAEIKLMSKKDFFDKYFPEFNKGKYEFVDIIFSNPIRPILM